MIKHGLKALKASAQETELSEYNVSVGFVGKGQDEKFRFLSTEELRSFLGEINVNFSPALNLIGPNGDGLNS